ncbi:MAG: DNA-processing protein DprA, partial [Rhizobiaceae bacterium]
GDLGQAGYVIVSGLARGIDSAAHQAGLRNGTVAVFAGGVDHIYPHQNRDLARAILDNGGALISEMPLGWKPRAQDFPRRNRIVSGMSLGLVVVEAAKRSGSLISARLANEIGRLVFAVPGSPLDPRSEGANHLIKQGASLITHARDIIQALEPMVDSPLQETYTLDEQSNREIDSQPDDSERSSVLNALSHAPVPVDDIMRYTGLDAGKVQMVILELDLAGKIERHSGNSISLV